MVEKIFFVSFKDRQRSGWSPVACLSLCLFPSPSSLSLAGVVLHPDLLSHHPLDGAYEQRGPVEKPTKLILLWEEQTSIGENLTQKEPPSYHRRGLVLTTALDNQGKGGREGNKSGRGRRRKMKNITDVMCFPSSSSFFLSTDHTKSTSKKRGVRSLRNPGSGSSPRDSSS